MSRLRRELRRVMRIGYCTLSAALMLDSEARERYLRDAMAVDVPDSCAPGYAGEALLLGWDPGQRIAATHDNGHEKAREESRGMLLRVWPIAKARPLTDCERRWLVDGAQPGRFLALQAERRETLALIRWANTAPQAREAVLV